MAVCSERSLSFLEKTDFYDEVLLNEDAGNAKALVEKLSPRRVRLLDFGARPGVMASYTSALGSIESTVPLTRFFVGGDNRPAKAEDAVKELGARGDGVQVNANTLRERGIELGGGEYFNQFDRAWAKFKDEDARKVMRLVWDEGMEGWANGWEAFCHDKVRGDEGRVYKL